MEIKVSLFVLVWLFITTILSGIVIGIIWVVNTSYPGFFYGVIEVYIHNVVGG